MKKLLFLSLIALIASCSNRPKEQKKESDEPFPSKYENVLFSVNYPKGWLCDDSGWLGLDSMTNEVDIYNPNGDVVSLHFVKTFLNFQWKDINEVTDMVKGMREISGDPVVLINEVDSVEVGGYPTHILYYADTQNPDTIIQKQFVTYMQDSHIVLYFNEIFYYRDWVIAQELGDDIIGTIKLKKVKNPLDDVEVMKNAVNSAIENDKIDKDYMERMKKILEEGE